MDNQFDDTKLRKYAKMAGWSEKISDYPGYFPGKQPGQQAIWSCRWQTSNGLVSPATMGMDLEKMPIGYIGLEVQDLSVQGSSYCLDIMDMFDQYEGLRFKADSDFYNIARTKVLTWLNSEKPRMIAALNLYRCSYPTYVALWDKPSNIEGMAIRTTWYTA